MLLLGAGDASLSAFRLRPGAVGGVSATAWPEHGGTAVGAALRAAGELNAASPSPNPNPNLNPNPNPNPTPNPTNQAS